MYHEQPIEQDKLDTGSKYRKVIRGSYIDVYDILLAYEVTNPAIQHAVKKLLVAGKRGYKDTKKDLAEANWSITRAMELNEDN